MADAHGTKAQLKQRVQDAPLPDQYSSLATYLGKQQTKYLLQPTKENQECQNKANIAAKNQRPVDSAPYLYEFYPYEASESGLMAAQSSQCRLKERTGCSIWATGKEAPRGIADKERASSHKISLISSV
jgi:hypothetical protein